MPDLAYLPRRERFSNSKSTADARRDYSMRDLSEFFFFGLGLHVPGT